MMNDNSPGATVPERICGAICALLLIASWTIADWTHDAQTQFTFLVAGFFFFMRTITFTFGNGMVAHHKGGGVSKRDGGDGQDGDK